MMEPWRRCGGIMATLWQNHGGTGKPLCRNRTRIRRIW
ncbi:hypothetical protein CLOBOL_01045 [Enterocloster bolteae ATCC BAA-613]|uniref:Uncharacterized protein n=1 Tax=Enterocloster bolteae (strain ATCC BAA-613 / DSM 15670 / CCUG 46953 / JCM 12243 / WAL 16351) TaxID=411902 RepID=A8RJW0_ENTBW|nr:hypothetical protein CLOBOL_01045 [Enterocloster bolteae ATCC BAA-613]